MATVKYTVEVKQMVTYLVEVEAGEYGWERAKTSARYNVAKGKVEPQSKEIISVEVVKETK